MIAPDLEGNPMGGIIKKLFNLLYCILETSSVELQFSNNFGQETITAGLLYPDMAVPSLLPTIVNR